MCSLARRHPLRNTALIAAAIWLALLAAPPWIAQAGPNCSATGSIDAEELRLLQLINNYRTQYGVTQLVFSNALNRSAAWKAQHVADNGYFAHDDTPISRTWQQRMRDCGYTANTYLGENLAGGDSTAAGALRIWQNSPGHNALMLDGTFRAVGLGRARDASGYWYWAMDVGGEVDARIAGGDVDCNNRINTVDASLILQRAAGLTPSLPCDTEADADNSGTVDAADALLVLQHAAGLVD
jgi:uncharacterized protein YkwD